jgi:hypothetical protein
MAFTDMVKNISAEKIVELIRPFIPEKWSQTFSGYGTYAVGVLMIVSGALPIIGIPVPWVPLGSEGQWIAGGIAAFTVRRAIANNKKHVLEAIRENTEITTKVASKVNEFEIVEPVEQKKKEGV